MKSVWLLCRRVAYLFLGRKEWQWLFERLHFVALKGMNYGGGAEYGYSGEKQAAVIASNKLLEKGIKNLVVFDVGANVGGYTDMILNICSPKFESVQVFAFEPARDTYAQLESRFKQDRRVRPLKQGLGVAKQEQALYVNANISGLSSLYKRKLGHYNIEFSDMQMVPVEALDHFCIENAIERVNFLKIDVEGAEMDVLQGGFKMVRENNIDVIQFEFGGTALDSRIFFKDFYELLSPNYHIYRILQNGLRELPAYSEQYEIFYPANFLAILKV